MICGAARAGLVIALYENAPTAFKPAAGSPCIIQTVDHHLEIAISTV